MRGEYCVYGATLLSLFSAIMLVFANVSQLSPGAVTSGLFFAEVNCKGLGTAYDVAGGGSGGLTTGDPKAALGQGIGSRQYYRWGVYGECGYLPNGGTCNATSFGYPFDPSGQIGADITTDRGMRGTLFGLLGGDQAITDSVYNMTLSRAANLLIFLGTVMCGIALVVGIFKTRITFLVATIMSGGSALFLMVGAAMWSAIVARNAPIATRMLTETNSVGVTVTAGAALYLVWVGFVSQTLSVIPYVISFLTFRRQNGKAYE